MNGYSLAQTADTILLLANWMNDDSGLPYLREIDREPIAASEKDAEKARTALLARNLHLLPAR